MEGGGRGSNQSSIYAQWTVKDPSFLHVDSEDSDQTGQMPRLISAFAKRTCHFVGFVMRRLIRYSMIIKGQFSSVLNKKTCIEYLLELL